MSDIQSSNFSETAASNNAASPNGAAEGIPPSAVNDIIREFMAAVKREWNRSHTTISSTGSANAYVLTYTTAPTLTHGIRLSFKANFSNTGAATVNPNSLGVTDIVKQTAAGQVPLVADDIVSTQHVDLEYDSATGDFVLLNPQQKAGGGVRAVTGTTDTILSSDFGKLVTYSNASAIAVTLPQATGNFANPFNFDVENKGAGLVTITPTTSTINGGATFTLSTDTGIRIFSDGTNYQVQLGKRRQKEAIAIPVTTETAAVTSGTGKVTFRMPYALTVTDVRASLQTAQTSGTAVTVDINDGGTTIISTKITIDNSEKTSTTAATPAVISDTALADDAEITIDVDAIGDGTAKGLKVYIIGYQP